MSNIDFINKIDISALKTGYGQPFSLITYDNYPLIIETGPIVLSHYAIPSLTNDNQKHNYYPDDSKRSFIKIQLTKDTDYLRKIMEDADNYFSSDKARKKMFNLKYKKYEYIPIIKISNNTKVKYPDSIKVNFLTSTDKSKVKTIVKKHDKIIEADTVTKIADHITKLSTVKFTIQFFKLWVSHTHYSVKLVINEMNIVNNYIRTNSLPIYDCITLKKVYSEYINDKNQIKNKKILFDI